MRSLAFPEMFDSSRNTVKWVDDKKAIEQNLQLLFHSTKQELLGDPFFGNNLRSLLFNLNDIIIRDLIIDEIYTSIKLCMPVLDVKRKDITITEEKGKLSINVKVRPVWEKELNLYSIPLLVGWEGA